MKRSLLILSVILLTLFLSIDSYAWTEKYCNCGDGGTGDGSVGDPWGTLQEAFDEVAAGVRINLLSTATCTLGATVDIDTTAGTTEAPIILQGYTSSAGDGGIAIVDGNSAAVSIFSIAVAGILLKDLKIYGSTGDAITSTSNADNIILENVEITNAGDDGINTASGAGPWVVLGCEVNATTAIGINGFGSPTFLYYNNIHDSGTHNFVGGVGGNSFYGNIFETTLSGANYYQSSGDVGYILNNTFYNAVGAGRDNITFESNDEYFIILNNIFSTSADYNIDSSAAQHRIIGYNCLHGGTTGTTNLSTVVLDLSVGDQAVDPQFTGAAARDFNIGANLDDDGYPTTYKGSTDTTGNREMGCCPYEETGGGGSVTVGYSSMR